MRRRPLRLGILSAEFFDPTLSRGRGGFGKNVRTVASSFRTHPELGVEVVLIHGFRRSPPDAVWTSLDGVPLLMRPAGTSRWSDWITYCRLLAAARLDALLTMDFSPPFRGTFLALPRTPAIVWAHDPRTPEDWTKIATLRIPGARGRPSDSRPVDCRSFRFLYTLADWTGRPLRIAVPGAFIAQKVAPTYGVVPPTVHFLPVFLDVPDVPRMKAKWPRVIFLGRLDPIKRPWVYWELARALPDVEFLCLGESYYPYEQDGGWTPSDPPANLRVLGHLDDPARAELLASSWLLVNTSIHEALPTSFLEALFCETPIVSCQDAGGLVSRFGRYVGRFDGEGLAAVPHFADAVQRLLDDPACRVDLGREGREWVIRHYNASGFLAAFSDLLSGMGLRWHPPIPVAGANNPS